MKAGKMLLAAIGLALMACGTGNAAELTWQSGVTVEVSFSDKIERALKRINSIEYRRERHFRKFKTERARKRVNNRNRIEFSKAVFGTERLVPKVREFTFETLIQRAVQFDLNEMQLEQLPATVKVRVDDLRISNYSLGDFKSHETRMRGSVIILDEAGKRVGAVKLTWIMEPQTRALKDPAYAGRDHAFMLESANVRMAPVTLGFIEKSLEYIYQGKDAPGPFFLVPRIR